MSCRAVLFNFSYKGREISSTIQLFCESFQPRASDVYNEDNFVDDIDDCEEILLMNYEDNCWENCWENLYDEENFVEESDKISSLAGECNCSLECESGVQQSPNQTFYSSVTGGTESYR